MLTSLEESHIIADIKHMQKADCGVMFIAYTLGQSMATIQRLIEHDESMTRNRAMRSLDRMSETLKV